MKFVEYPDRDMMFLSLADRLTSELGDFLRREPRATFCVPGGTTPGPIFDVLGDIDLDWGRVSILPSDERWLPEDAPRSNARLVKNRLLQDKAAAAQFVPLYNGTENPGDKIDELIEQVRVHLPIHVLLLGMGGDLHTASIIPGAEGAEAALAADAPVLVPIQVPGASEARITLSAPVLRQAMRVHVVIVGPEKRAALERADKMSLAEAPIRVILDDATVHWAE
ncbi:6-phosphogluconolactonase [Acidimangrovimonas sediminis]|uniref:6-phosphogluconolactonase n=1 Tax=Acidimangrovimonas sediminis TaxID=2056283 RepID=UPI000C80CB0B|nr:6-phosphogluconolactonase [Acidimangrovimonas sediminis]